VPGNAVTPTERPLVPPAPRSAAAP
jgi:hypothetical protein